jgi:hypothetical protein
MEQEAITPTVVSHWYGAEDLHNCLKVPSFRQQLKGSGAWNTPQRLQEKLLTSRDSITPIIRTLVIRNSNYPDKLGPSGNFVENSTQLISLEIAGYWIEHSTVRCYPCT